MLQNQYSGEEYPNEIYQCSKVLVFFQRRYRKNLIRWLKKKL